ncbi:MAG: hypothetical protein CBB68_14220 [Rhodospirillaceae bacterium TMED8]|nr:hypothetical protein [Magnetovibrio sp.]OUT48115.1 MAG: hypothetical protein CBB68_14220 [Rhodospirillaceae bacterium TMED8]|tara:strand:+ start:1604 stop:1882 length:279 start_codon:yes stop_codon:yes gene_type:complete
MSRVLLQYLLPLIGPLVLYLIYVAIMRRRAAKFGNERPPVDNTYIFYSVILGFFLMVAGLIFWAFSDGKIPGEGSYQSPRVQDGRIVAPKFK